MKKYVPRCAFAAMLCALGVPSQSAWANTIAGSTVTITFDEMPPPGNPPLTELLIGDFRFASEYFHSVSLPAGGTYDLVDNGTTFIAEASNGLGHPITLTRIDGAPFSLLAIDLGEGFLNDEAAAQEGYYPSDAIEIVGLLPDGSATSFFEIMDDIMDGPGGVPDFQTTTLPAEFCNVTSVTFYGNGFPGQTSLAIDNVVVGPAIPEPATGALGLIGVLTILARYRRRTKIKSTWH